MPRQHCRYGPSRRGIANLSLTSDSATRIKPREEILAEATLSYRPDPNRAVTATRFPGSASGAPAPKFIIRDVIGTGGYGVVHDAVQTSLSRVVAVKKLRDEFYEAKGGHAPNNDWLEHLFRQEAVTTGLLEHPNIVPIHDLSADDNGHPLLALKLVRGKTWDLLMNEDFAMPMPEFLARHLPILVDVAQATAFAHSRGIVHRDLKPHQVMVGEFGEALLMDWGLAAVYDPQKLLGALQDSGDVQIIPTIGTTADNPAGSPSFMAPEQTESTSGNIGPWTDVFLLGGILYTILTAVPPHRMTNLDSPLKMFEVARKCEIIPPEQRVPDLDIPPELSSLCMRAMALDPADRVPSAAAFLRELQDFISGAGKRRESVAISAAVAERMKTNVEQYSDLSAIDSQLERALALWPGNHEALQLRQHALLQYANMAAANGDLTLARVQAERLAPSADREELLQEISIHEHLNEREETEAEEAELNRRQAMVELKDLNDQLQEAARLLASAKAALDSGSEAPNTNDSAAREISAFLKRSRK